MPRLGYCIALPEGAAMSSNVVTFLIIAAGLVAIAYFANSLVGAFR